MTYLHDPNISGRIISWWSPPVGDKQGYGYAAVNFIEALQRRDIRVEYNTEGPGVHISWVQPPWYEGYKHQYTIGYSPWESTVLPKAWVRQMNDRDEIWTPTKWCKEIYIDNGIVAPIHVVPHGVNSDHYPLTPEVPEGRFTFFHVGAPTERKGAQRVFDAFVDLFDGNNDVQLLMKSTGPSDARTRDSHGLLHNVSYHPQVRVFEETAEVDVMRELYQQAHCMVYPSSGEGFGLIPFQSIAMGIPTILTGGTGLSDFAHLGYPVDYKWVDGQGLHLGQWCEPDRNDLRDKMKWVYENYSSAKIFAMKSGRWLQENMSWNRIAEDADKLLGAKIRV